MTEKTFNANGIPIRYARVDKTLPAFKPSKYDDGDAGFDLYARETKWIFPFVARKIPTNVCFEIPKGFFGRVCGRSGQTLKGKIVWAGTIDASYRGEVNVIMSGLLPRRVKRGERIAQIIFMPCMVNNEMTEVEIKDLTATKRGDGGFGSSGRY